MLALAAATLLAAPAPLAQSVDGVQIICNSNDTTVAYLRTRPKDCRIFPPGSDLQNAARLVKLKWSSWGGAEAKAKGKLRPKRDPQYDLAATITAYRIREDTCGSGLRFYTRVKVKTKYGTGVSKAQECFGND